jgi:hypothetical protein
MHGKSAQGARMNKQEFLLNKPLLKEINTKKKDGPLSHAGDMISQEARSHGRASQQY